MATWRIQGCTFVYPKERAQHGGSDQLGEATGLTEGPCQRFLSGRRTRRWGANWVGLRFFAPCLWLDMSELVLLSAWSATLSRETGLRQPQASQKMMTSNVGTVQWMAPEMMTGVMYNEKAALLDGAVYP